MRTLKEVLVWINEFTSPSRFMEALNSAENFLRLDIVDRPPRLRTPA